jgi:hypothetical protein
MGKHTTAWWFLAESVCERLSTPKTDVADADRQIEALVRGSWLWSRGDALVSRLRAASLDSWSRRLVGWAAGRSS